MKKYLIAFFSLFLSTFVVVSCNNKATDNNDSVEATENAENLTNEVKLVNPIYNEVSRYMAGLNSLDSSAINDIFLETSWQDFHAEFDESWSTYLDGMQVVKDFALENISYGDTLYYPFSGPDFNYANLLFPEAKTIYLLALENIGEIPNVFMYSANQRLSLCNMIKTSISSNLEHSFFRTKSMEVDYDNTTLKGSLPAILIFMVRHGYMIQNINPMTINEDGSIEYTNADQVDSYSLDKKFDELVEIKYFKEGDTEYRTLYYLSSDVSNSGIEREPKLTKYIDQIGSNYTTFLKSASYLMHKDYFNEVRDRVLANSDYIIQDPSGVPYRYFDESWDVSLYGVYAGPITLFHNYMQHDLDAAFLTDQKKGELPFRFGYKDPSCMYICTKK